MTSRFGPKSLEEWSCQNEREKTMRGGELDDSKEGGGGLKIIILERRVNRTRKTQQDCPAELRANFEVMAMNLK